VTGTAVGLLHSTNTKGHIQETYVQCDMTKGLENKIIKEN